MVPSVACWYDVLVWGKWEYFGRLSTIVQYVRVCLTDGIAYCTTIHLYSCHDSILFQMDAHSLFNNVNNQLHFGFQFHMRRGLWCFSQSSMCVSTLSQHSKMEFNYFQTILCWVNNQHSILKLFELSLFLIPLEVSLSVNCIFVIQLLQWPHQANLYRGIKNKPNSTRRLRNHEATGMIIKCRLY